MAQDPDAKTSSVSVTEFADALLDGPVGDGMRAQLGILAVYDALGNQDGRISAADIDPEDPDTEIFRRYDADIALLRQGMERALRNLTTRFDANGDSRMSVEEAGKLLTQLEAVYDTEAPVREGGAPLSTAELIDAYERGLNHGLPPLPTPTPQGPGRK